MTSLQHVKNFKSLFVILLFFVTSIKAQQCQPFNPAYAPASGDVCPPFLYDLIWNPGTSPIDLFLIDEVFNSTILRLIRAIQPITPTECYQYMLSIACNTAFQPCENVFVPALNDTVALAMPPCKSTCERTNQICESVPSNVIPPLDCTRTSPFTGLEEWPERYLETIINGIVVNSSCMSVLPVAEISWGSVACPYPLSEVPDPTDSQSPCAISCPDPTWTPDQWHTLSQLMYRLASLSFSLMLFLCFLYLSNPDYRACSRRISLHTFIVQMMFALSIMLGGNDPEHEVWCTNDFQLATIQHPACGIQALFFVFFGLSTAIWMAASAAILYLRLHIVKFRITKENEAACCILAYGIPLILCIIPAQLGLMQGYWRVPLCFVEGYIGNSDLAYHYFFFYLPVFASLVIAEGFVVATIIKLLLHKRSLKKSFKIIFLKDDGKMLARLNRRLLFWCVALIGIFTTLLVYRLKLGNRSETQDWIVCKINSEIGLGPSTECAANQIPEAVSYGATLTHYAVISSVGTFSFLASGTERELYLFWWRIFKFAREKNWCGIWRMLTMEKKKRKAKILPNALMKESSPRDRTGLSPTPSHILIFSSTSAATPCSTESSTTSSLPHPSSSTSTSTDALTPPAPSPAP